MQEDSLKRHQKALELYQNKVNKIDTTHLSEAHIHGLIQELEVKQIELELQNQELKVAKAAIHTAAEKYSNFFEFASLGFLMIEENGKIIDANTTTSNLLKTKKSKLVGTYIEDYICENYKLIFKKSLARLINGETEETCLVQLINNDNGVIYLNISGLILNNETKQCHLILKNHSFEVQQQEDMYEKQYFFKEFQRIGNIGSCKLNVVTGIWENATLVRAILGLNEQDPALAFETWLDLIHPDDKTETELEYYNRIATKTIFNKEFRIIRKQDKKVCWILVKAEFSDKYSQQETIALVVIHDITEEKLAIEKIKNAETRSYRIFESSKEGILILDAVTGKITDANPFLIEMIGFSYSELVGKELWEIGVFKNIATSKDAFVELQDKEYIRFDDMPLETKNGKSIDVEFVSIVYSVENQKHVLCHIRDISDRKKADALLLESSQLYLAMFEKNVAVLLLINPETGKIVDANGAATKFYGYTLPQFKAMNLSDISTFPPKQILKEVEKLRLSNQSYFQFLHKLASGETREVEIYTSQLLIKGKVLLISTINDITERKLEEERLVLLNKQLKEVNILKSQFISTVSHEFRTPLAGILSSVQLLKIYNDTWDKEKKEKMYKQIFDAVQHTKSLLDDVSLIESSQNSKTFFRPSYFELIPLINEIIDENLAISGTNHQIVLKNNMTVKECFMDAIMIRHILNNLLSNAIKYSPESNKINFYVDEIDNNEIKIVIKDQGIGIPAEEIKFLLEPFFRATNTGSIKGTGFGMSIVKRFVELHDGQIFIESTINIGTKVTIILPFKKEKYDDDYMF